jgi:hypothetical protein
MCVFSCIRTNEMIPFSKHTLHKKLEDKHMTLWQVTHPVRDLWQRVNTASDRICVRLGSSSPHTQQATCDASLRMGDFLLSLVTRSRKERG